MTSIGCPGTVPPKPATAICAATTEPGPSAAEEGPDMSVRTPIFNTSSDICAQAGPAAATDSMASAASNKRRMFLLPGRRASYADFFVAGLTAGAQKRCGPPPRHVEVASLLVQVCQFKSVRYRFAFHGTGT